jgi:hypothetical protein
MRARTLTAALRRSGRVLPRSRVELNEDARRVLLAQGGYYIGTGLLPYVSRRLFEAMTGPKQEWWLVETVGGLVTVVGVGLGVASLRGETTPELLGIGAGCAATLAGIDIVYVLRGRIAPTYLVDAGVEIGLIGALALSKKRAHSASPSRHGPRLARSTGASLRRSRVA